MDRFIEKYNLFIFDLDDTIVKTEKYHYDAWILTLQQFVKKDFYINYGDFCLKFHSKIENSIKTYLVNELNLSNYDDIIKTKNELYFDIIKKNNIYLVNGFYEFINKIIDKNKEFVIVSNSLKSHIDLFSDIFPILKKSSKNYYREILTNKKPHSECYQKVLIDFPNRNIVGFEDSITGIQSITQIPEILTYFINTREYIHYEYILQNYNVIQINDYLDLV